MIGSKRGKLVVCRTADIEERILLWHDGKNRYWKNKKCTLKLERGKVVSGAKQQCSNEPMK